MKKHYFILVVSIMFGINLLSSQTEIWREEFNNLTGPNSGITTDVNNNNIEWATDGTAQNVAKPSQRMSVGTPSETRAPPETIERFVITRDLTSPRYTRLAASERRFSAIP